MITILDYGAGNLRSVQRACHALGEASVVVQDADGLRSAERIIFPGIGAAPAAMENLSRIDVAEALTESVHKGIPTLGICIGAQVALARSEEGDTPCLGLIPGVTRLFDLKDAGLKVPHIGWNEVRTTRPHPLLAGIEPGDEFYFVHSYFLDPSEPDNCYAVSDYGGDFCSMIWRDNVYATQFHPEKSQDDGLTILKNFAELA